MLHLSFRRRALPALVLTLTALAGAPAYVSSQGTPEAGKGTWQAEGTLLESCTCAVPCTCNFGQGPSPNHFCHAIFAYRLEKAHWDGTDLSGLGFGGADGPDGVVGFVDERASPEQRALLEKIGRAIFAKGGPVGGARPFVPVPITHEANDRNLSLKLGAYGGFTARILMGRDGRRPIVVENNTTWPIERAIKGKASSLTLADPGRAGKINASGVNANYGTFRLSGRTESPGAVAAASTPARPAADESPSCCGKS